MATKIGDDFAAIKQRAAEMGLEIPVATKREGGSRQQMPPALTWSVVEEYFAMMHFARYGGGITLKEDCKIHLKNDNKEQLMNYLLNRWERADGTHRAVARAHGDMVVQFLIVMGLRLHTVEYAKVAG